MEINSNDFPSNFEYGLYKVLLSTRIRIDEVYVLERSDLGLINGTIKIDKTYSKTIK
ncbi:phage integrase [Streptococcus parauberis]|nr:hypothetical protein SPJ2_1300 [Streptococcus parauberis KRS-02109]GAJ62184.1 phage integrase [Streptococcus parauberis]